MRAWIAVGALLVASARLVSAAGGSEVPALADGEAAPANLPNYFDTKELGAATLAVLAACQDAVAGSYPDLAEAAQASYCGCFADTARLNVRVGRAAIPTAAQSERCADAARGPSSSPFAHQFATPTASISSTFQLCMEVPLDGASTTYLGFTCSCATNAWISDRLQASKLDDDIAKCVAAAQYREETGLNPTLRQFRGIRIAPARTRTGSGTQLEGASPGAFIPYPGNGGGPTLCSDGMYSHSSGKGTCSHHGGIAGGRHRRR